MHTRYRLDVSHWYVARLVYLMAGAVSMTGLVLMAITGTAWWLLINALVALMQMIFALTGWCPSAMLMHSLGVAEK